MTRFRSVASAPQVHRARLQPSGLLRRRKTVAVKVQRPGAKDKMLRDLKNVRAFFSIGVVRGSLAWDPDEILDQASKLAHGQHVRQTRAGMRGCRSRGRPSRSLTSWERRE